MSNKITLHNGDSAKVLKQYPDNHFDSIVTDPPYGIEFLSKEWDKNTGPIEVWRECLRVLKPGGHILAFSAARTYHRLATNLEDIGFEIRDQLQWIYGSGFPKGQDMGKLIEKREGKKVDLQWNGDVYNTDKKVVSFKKSASGQKCNFCGKDKVFAQNGSCKDSRCDGGVYKADNEWSGWKTGLKPAHEPIVMARKPFKGSTVDNVLKHGTGAINIDDTRVPANDLPGPEHYSSKSATGGLNGEIWNKNQTEGSIDVEGITSSQTLGRYPSNVIFSEEEAKVLDEKTGIIKAVGGKVSDGDKNWNPESWKPVIAKVGSSTNQYVNEPPRGASKYFYCPKVSRKERHIGYDLDGIHTNGGLMFNPETGKAKAIEQQEQYDKYFYCPKVSRKERNVGYDLKDIPTYSEEKRAEGIDPNKPNVPEYYKKEKVAGNNHPTVKPVALMKYLVTLVTPKGGKVLDPFNGSGSTGMAVKEFGGEYTGIDLDPNYIEIAHRRILSWTKGE